MKQNQQKQLNRGGFTLIEVVLVLAIGGLIFLLAFIAFQQVSTNRRDTQRRNDAGRVLAEVQNAAGDGFKINSQTKLTGGSGAASSPTGNTNFLATYLGGGMEGPQANYTFTYTASAGAVSTTDADQMTIGAGMRCTPDSNNSFTAQTGSYAVIMGLEKGSVCRDDQ